MDAAQMRMKKNEKAYSAAIGQLADTYSRMLHNICVI